MPRFFLVVPPSLEEAAHIELLNWWPKLLGPTGGLLGEAPPKVLGIRGGLEFETSLEAALQLNLVLKVPSRVLLRLDEFRCRDFPTLHRKLAREPWRKYFDSAEIEWSVSSSGSRVAIKSRIEETCKDAYKDYCENQPPGKNFFKYKPMVHVRFNDDICTVSLDASGEHLHRRGYRKMVSDAPLRENIAAGLAIYLKEDSGIWGGTFVDPMCGSGVFPLEVALLSRPLRLRRFDFELWRNCPEFLKFENRKRWSKTWSELHAEEKSFTSFAGYDIDEKAIAAAQENAGLAGVSDLIKFEVRDLFSEEVKKKVKPTDMVLCNPPWGERLKLDYLPEEFFTKALTAIEKKYQPKAVGVLVPATTDWKNVKVPPDWRATKKISLDLGGTNVLFRMFLASRDY